MAKNKSTFSLPKKYFDDTIRPQDDFFHFVNNGWFAEHAIPKTETSWGSFYVLRRDTRRALKRIIDTLGKTKKLSGEKKKLYAYYQAGMDTKRMNKEGKDVLREYLSAIEEITDTKTLAQYIATLHRDGVNAFWSLFIEPNFKNTKQYIRYIYQDGIGLPDRDYYTKKDEQTKTIQKQYQDHMERMFVLVGMDKKCAERLKDQAYKVERKLARASMTRVEQRDPEKIYNRVSVKELRKITPHIDWSAYFKTIGFSAQGSVIASQPKFLAVVDALFRQKNFDDIRAYLSWMVLASYGSHFGTTLEKEQFNFYGATLSGLEKMRPRWERILSETESVLGDALGKLYVKAHFSKRAKREITELVSDITAAYRARLKELRWMSKQTKQQALKKLDAMTLKLGYPDKWRSYANLSVGGSYVRNAIAAHRFEFDRDRDKLGTQVDRTEWHMPASTVNAFYSPDMNEIAFPAAILQPPFFTPDAPKAYNYGAIGAIIGHELTHGFDDSGSKFDAKGNLKNWWKPSDRRNFDTRSKQLVTQYNKSKLYGTYPVNGKLTLGENIADLGGFVIAFDAYRRAKAREGIEEMYSGYTDEQVYFIAGAIAERGMRRKAWAIQLLVIDPHSPPEFRINIPYSNMDEFHEVFDVSKGDQMYRSPKQRVKIW